MSTEREVDFSTLVGKVITEIEQDDGVLNFYAALDGLQWQMRHDQDCCEQVYIESIVGDLSDLLLAPILMAEETSNREASEHGDSTTWTFYKLATIKGYVDIRWCGSSNGYYSEAVSFYESTT